jgi:hypothetical protein
VKLDLATLGSFFKVTETFFLSTSLNPAVQIAKNDYNRYAIIFSPQGGSAGIGLSQGAAQNAGTSVLNTTLPFVLSFEAVGALVQQQWFGFMTSPTGGLDVIEVFYLPPKGSEG